VLLECNLDQTIQAPTILFRQAEVSLERRWQCAGVCSTLSLIRYNEKTRWAVDNFVAEIALSFHRFQLNSTKRRKKFILNQLETTRFNKNLVRDQGVGGSNPLAPTTKMRGLVGRKSSGRSVLPQFFHLPP
jgi:hypothetical protein